MDRQSVHFWKKVHIYGPSVSPFLEESPYMEESPYIKYISKRRKRRDRHRASFIETAVPETLRHEQGTVGSGLVLNKRITFLWCTCVGLHRASCMEARWRISYYFIYIYNIYISVCV